MSIYKIMHYAQFNNIIMNQRTRKVRKILDLSRCNRKENTISIMMCLMIWLMTNWLMRIILCLLSHFASVSMNEFHLISVCRVGENVWVVFASDLIGVVNPVVVDLVDLVDLVELVNLIKVVEYCPLSLLKIYRRSWISEDWSWIDTVPVSVHYSVLYCTVNNHSLSLR